uniref:Uncharacterized protein n=1 Tax=Rhizophora mucronata TaxID=61149 RepID=A0A2P2P4G1_RHIMU
MLFISRNLFLFFFRCCIDRHCLFSYLGTASLVGYFPLSAVILFIRFLLGFCYWLGFKGDFLVFLSSFVVALIVTVFFLIKEPQVWWATFLCLQ